jgi:hypothetical protein
VPGSDCEIDLPAAIRYEIVQAIDSDSRDDPAVFEPAKEYAFGHLDSGPFQRFLKDKCYVNITANHAILMLVLGLVLLFGGFMVALVMLFLDKPRTSRLYSIVPLFFGMTALFASATRFSLWLGLTHHGQSGTLFQLNKYKDAFIRQLHTKRAIKHLFLSLLFTAIVVGVLVALPNYRL